MNKHVEKILEVKDISSLLEMRIRDAMIESAERAYFETKKGRASKYFIMDSSLPKIIKKYEPKVI